MDKWPYFIFEENIKLVNEITEEEENNNRESEEAQKAGMPNFDANAMMKNASSLTQNLPKY
jgi:hypothetical protein